MKKMLIIACSFVVLVLTLSIAIDYYTNKKLKPRNIFDEIYLETEKTYRSNNILGNIDNFKIRGSWPSDDPNISKTPHGIYKKESIPNDYSETWIGANFTNNKQTISINFYKKLDSNTILSVWSMYHFKDKTLENTVDILLKENDSTTYIDKESQVKAYLQKYGITTDDLDHYYDEIVNKKVLPDWCSIYDSKFSPSNYGDIIIKTQWRDW